MLFQKASVKGDTDESISLIVAAAALAGLAYLILNDQENRIAAHNGLGDAANDMSQWGSEQRIKGTGDKVGGTLKQGLGKLTGDKQLQGEGVLDETIGTVADAAGKAAHAVSDALHQS